MLPLAPFAVSALTTAGKALAGGVTAALTGSGSAKATEAGSADAATGITKTGITKTGPAKPADKARKTADDFETMFLEQSLERLTASDSTEGPLGENGVGGGVYRSMMSQQYAQTIAKSGGVGVSDQVYGAILKMQEAGNGR